MNAPAAQDGTRLNIVGVTGANRARIRESSAQQAVREQSEKTVIESIWRGF
jgi:hypothetical protein